MQIYECSMHDRKSQNIHTMRCTVLISAEEISPLYDSN